MDVELVPDPGADPATRAALAALAQAALIADPRPPAYDGAWRRAAVRDAVERSVVRSLDRSGRESADADRYVLPARSTDGAKRA